MMRIECARPGTRLSSAPAAEVAKSRNIVNFMNFASAGAPALVD
jgi:hypothetical protein